MKTIPITFQGTPVNGSPGGIPAGKYWARQNVFGGCYGFSLRPWMAANDIAAGAGAGYKWTSSLGAPNPPGLLPIIAVCTFENGGVEVVMVVDATFHHFGNRRIQMVDLYVPLGPLTPYAATLTGTLISMGYVALVMSERGEGYFPSSEAQLRRFPLFYADAWADTTNGRPYLCLTASASFAGKIVDPMNFWGLDDAITPGATGATIGGFYIFSGCQRWRAVLKTQGSAADVSIWTLADQGDFLAEGLVLNEVVSASDWTSDPAGKPVLVLERESSFNGEWIYLTANGAAGPGALNASAVYVTGGDLVVKL